MLSMTTTEEIRDLLSEFILDLPKTTQYLGVSQNRLHKILKSKPIESVIGPNCFLLRDVEKLKKELVFKRKRYGTGWSSSGSDWVFSQENVLKILIALYKKEHSDVALKQIINSISSDLEYPDKSVRVLFALKRLVSHGIVEKSGRGMYHPKNPDVDVKQQLPVTKEFYVYDAGNFEPNLVYAMLNELGGVDVPITKLWKRLNMEDEDPKKARYMTRRALNLLLRDNKVTRSSRGKYSVLKEKR